MEFWIHYNESINQYGKNWYHNNVEFYDHSHGVSLYIQDGARVGLKLIHIENNKL